MSDEMFSQIKGKIIAVQSAQSAVVIEGGVILLASVSFSPKTLVTIDL